MDVAEAQREVRSVFIGGFPGQIASGGLWLLSAALGTWISPARGIVCLVLGGLFIFPLTRLILRLMRRPASLSRGNPLGQLATQVAFTIPLMLPVVAGATLYRLNWFYPACMLVVGSHYLPFVFLYGMWQFAVLAGVLIGSGVVIGLYFGNSFALGGWLTGVVLLVFAFVGRSVVVRELTMVQSAVSREHSTSGQPSVTKEA